MNKATITSGAGEIGAGKIVQSTKNRATGHINTSGTYEDYK